jgi:hypothetical protein
MFTPPKAHTQPRVAMPLLVPSPEDAEGADRDRLGLWRCPHKEEVGRPQEPVPCLVQLSRLHDQLPRNHLQSTHRTSLYPHRSCRDPISLLSCAHDHVNKHNTRWMRQQNIGSGSKQRLTMATSLASVKTRSTRENSTRRRSQKVNNNTRRGTVRTTRPTLKTPQRQTTPWPSSTPRLARPLHHPLRIPWDTTSKPLYHPSMSSTSSMARQHQRSQRPPCPSMSRA